MNRAWVAVAGLAAIAAVAVATWADAVARVPVAALPTADECRQFHIDLHRERERDKAYGMAREGEARFDGYCFPKDRTRGIGLVEQAVANGAEDAALLLRDLYEEIGDSGKAEKWGRLTALALYSEFQDRVRAEVNGAPLPEEVLTEWRAILGALNSTSAEQIVPRLDALAARPPILPKAESRFWFAASYALRDLGTGESEYQFARGEMMGRWGFYLPGKTEVGLFHASECHHTGAIIEHTRLFLSDRPLGALPERIVQALARLHHLTGSHAALLAEAERKLGRPAFRDDGSLIDDLATAARRCRALAR